MIRALRMKFPARAIHSVELHNYLCVPQSQNLSETNNLLLANISLANTKVESPLESDCQPQNLTVPEILKVEW